MRVASLVLLAALLAGCAGAPDTTTTTTPAAPAPCTPTGLHEHASFAVYLDNQSVSWNNAAFAFPRTGTLAGHVHPPATHTLHMEGGRTCTDVGGFFRTALKSTLTNDSLTLDDVIHGGRSVHDGANGSLRFLVGEPDAAWRATPQNQRHYQPASNVTWREVDDLAPLQPYDGEYLLVTFGHPTDADVRWQELSIPTQTAAE